MISIELIFPIQDKRLCARVSESLSIGDYKRKILPAQGIRNGCIFMPGTNKNITDDMTLSEAGMHSGSGVIIEYE